MNDGIVFAGDLHLSRQIYASHPNMRGDTRFALKQITDYCQDHKLPLVLLGDNFNKRYPSPEVIGWFLEAVQDIDVFFIQGQHDMQTELAWPAVEPFSGSSRVHLDVRDSATQAPKCTVVRGVNLYGFDFLPRTKLQDRLKEVPADCEILCLHQLIKDVMGIEDSWHLDIEWVPEHVKVTVLGDWHGSPQDGITAGRRWLYTGSSAMQSVMEPTAKTFLLCTRGDYGKTVGGNFKFIREPLRTRPYIFGDVRYEHELDEWCSRIKASCEQAYEASKSEGVPDAVARPFVVLRYSVDIANAHHKIMDVLGQLIESGMVYYHPMPNRALVADGDDADVLGRSVSVDDAISELIDRELAPELHGLVTELAHASEPKEVVHAFKHRHEVFDTPTCGGNP